MSGFVRDALRKIAMRIYKDPTSYTIDDVKKMARGILLLVDGKLP